MVFLIAPLFFDGRQNGIGRLSGGAAAAFEQHFGTPCHVWGANDALDAKMGPNDRAFAGRYVRMVGAALTLPKPKGVKMVFASHLGLTSVAYILARRWGVPFATFLSGVECWGRYPFRTEFAMKRANAFCAISQYTLRTFLEAHPNLAHVPARVTLLAMPEDFKSQVAPAPKPAVREGPGKILAVGRIVRSEGVETERLGVQLYKGFRPLIEAAERVALGGNPVEVRIVGDGDARRDLESWARSFARAARVTFLGKVSDEDLAKEYAQADLFSLPSEREGFGYVFVEAMANGLPCVCIKKTAPEEIVVDGVTGLAATSGDIDDLATKLRRILLDGDLRRRMGQAGFQRYKDTFQGEHFQKRFLSALADMKVLNA